MLNSLEIRNYRNLRHLTIEKLGRVNLLVGKNNTGKTSVLEAVAIRASVRDELSTIKSLLERRGEYYASRSQRNSSSIEDNVTSLSSLFTDYSPDYFASEGSGIYIGEIRENDFNYVSSSLYIDLRKAYKVIRVDNAGKEFSEYVTAEKEEEINQEEVRYEIKFFRGLRGDTYSLGNRFLFTDPDRKVSKEPVQFQYVDSKNKTQETIESMYSKIALSIEKENAIVEALQIIEFRTVDFRIIEDGKTVIRLDNGERRNLSSMGDGVSRIFSIILSMVSCNGTYLLIDEFENGLHYSVQEKLWKIIFRLAKRLHIQVFATTHSLDCVEAFSSVLDSGNHGEDTGVMIRLENYEGNIEATVYDAEEIQATTRVQVDPR